MAISDKVVLIVIGALLLGAALCAAETLISF